MVLVIGHRGAPHYAPENTLSGFERAVELGANGLELDIRSCSEPGVAIVHHDESVDRTTSGSGYVSKMSIDQIKALDAGFGESVPLLSDVFQSFAGKVRLFIEIKSLDVTGVVTDLIEQYVRCKGCVYDDFVVIGFNPSALKEVHDANQNIFLGANVTLEYKLREEGDLEVFHCRKGHELHDIVQICDDYPWLYSVNPHRLLVSKALVVAVQNSAKQVYTWTVNEGRDVSRVLAAGVDGVMSDDPAMIRGLL